MSAHSDFLELVRTWEKQMKYAEDICPPKLINTLKLMRQLAKDLITKIQK